MDVDSETARWAQDEDSAVAWCESAEAIFEALSGGITDIEVGGTAADMSAVSEALCQVAQRLTSLSLTGCGLDGAALTRLGSVLAQTQMRGVGVSNNGGIDVAAWTEFWEKLPATVVKYDFGDNGLPDEALPRLVQVLSRAVEVKELFLDGNLLTDISPLLPLVPGLSELDIGDNSLGDNQAVLLSQVLPNSSLETLVLGRNQFGDIGGVPLAKTLAQTQICILHLDSTQIGDATIDALIGGLAECQLAELHIDETKISDAGMMRLCRALSTSKITMLDACDNNLSEETLAAIEAALPKDTTVE